MYLCLYTDQGHWIEVSLTSELMKRKVYLAVSGTIQLTEEVSVLM